MAEIFNFSNYREYLLDWIEAQGARSHGLKGRMAAALSVSSSLISQMLKGEKSLTPDQTSELCEFIGLNELESDYLHLLVEIDRAGTPRYREKLNQKLRLLQKQSRQIGKRVQRKKELTDEQRAIFYSSWIYTGVSNVTAIPGMDHAETVGSQLKIEPRIVHRVLRFLLEIGLVQENNGRFTYEPNASHTHLDQDSPFVNKHHQNWRVKAIQHMETRHEQDLFFTAPLSLSNDAADEIRKLLPNFIQSIMKIAGPSPSERTACLNIDWFKY